MTIRITKHFDFEAAHALPGYDGKCKNIHGHSYQLFVTIIGTPINDKTHPKNGMVLDFGDLKKIVKLEIINTYDHSIVLNKNSEHVNLAKKIADYSQRIVLVNYQPTSELMLVDFAKKISSKLPKDVKLHSLKLYETNNSYAEWFANDQI